MAALLAGRTKRGTFIAIAVASLIVRSALRSRGDGVHIVASLSVEAVIEGRHSVGVRAVDVLLFAVVVVLAARRARDAGLSPIVGALLALPGGTAFVPALMLPSVEATAPRNDGPYRAAEERGPSWIVRLLGGRERAATVGIGVVGVALWPLSLPMLLLSGSAALFVPIPLAGLVAGAITVVSDPHRDAAYFGRVYRMVYVGWFFAQGLQMLSYQRPAPWWWMPFFMLGTIFGGTALVTLSTALTGWIGRWMVLRVSRR